MVEGCSMHKTSPTSTRGGLWRVDAPPGRVMTSCHKLRNGN